MGRTQIYLGEADLALLKDAEERTGASRSELIRRAVRASYGQGSVAGRVAPLRRSAGSWSDRTTTGAEYVDEIRADLNEQLALGADLLTTNVKHFPMFSGLVAAY